VSEIDITMEYFMKDKPKMGGDGKHSRRRMKGKGAFEDFFNNTVGGVLDPNKNGLTNELTNPDSVLANAIDPKKNGVADALAKTFDPQKNGLADAVKAIKDTFDKIDFGKLDQDAKNALDPKLNGIDAAFQKFGGDAKKAFEDIADKIRKSAQESGDILRAGIDRLKNEFDNPNSDLSVFFKDLGVDITENYLKNPDFWFDVVSVVVLAASLVVTAPIGGVGAPVAFAAMQAMIAGAKMLSHAAEGKQISPVEVGFFLLTVIPATGIANQVGSKVAQAGSKTAGALLDAVLVAPSATSLFGTGFLGTVKAIGASTAVSAGIFAVGAASGSASRVLDNKELPAQVLVAQSLAAEEQMGQQTLTHPPERTPVPAAPTPAASGNRNQFSLPTSNYAYNPELTIAPPPVPTPELPKRTLITEDDYAKFDAQTLAAEKAEKNADDLRRQYEDSIGYVDPNRSDQMTGGGGLTGKGMHGGSELIQYAYTHALNKRPRLNYDPSFFC